MTPEVVRDFLSLNGTIVNCAGGPTPWGSWLTCEESVEGRFYGWEQEHGYIFEVPATAEGLVTPVPLTAMGRFVHEAAAVDPRTGIVYLSEDQQDSLFYRFLPASKGQLARGGRLQALALAEGPQRDLRNWEGAAIGVGGTVEARWIDLDNVEAPDADLKLRGFARGALRFARGEGLTIARSGGRSEVYLCATSGGPARLGQVWRYVPSRFEGLSGEAAEPGILVGARVAGDDVADRISGDYHVNARWRSGGAWGCCQGGGAASNPVLSVAELSWLPLLPTHAAHQSRWRTRPLCQVPEGTIG